MNQVYIVQSQVNLSNKTLRAILNNIIRPSIIETQNQTPNTVVSDPIVGHTTQYHPIPNICPGIGGQPCFIHGTYSSR